MLLRTDIWCILAVYAVFCICLLSILTLPQKKWELVNFCVDKPFDSLILQFRKMKGNLVNLFTVSVIVLYQLSLIRLMSYSLLSRMLVLLSSYQVHVVRCIQMVQFTFLLVLRVTIAIITCYKLVSICNLLFYLFKELQIL